MCRSKCQLMGSQAIAIEREGHAVGQQLLTEVGGIVVGRALQAHAAEKHDRVLGRALVGASTRA